MASQVLIVLILQTLGAGVRSFNLEPNLPVIKRGAESSYFGFSVAQHSTDDELGQGVPWYVNVSLKFLNIIISLHETKIEWTY